MTNPLQFFTAALSPPSGQVQFRQERLVLLQCSAELVAVAAGYSKTQCHPVPPVLAKEEGETLMNPDEFPCTPHTPPKQWGILEAEVHQRLIYLNIFMDRLFPSRSMTVQMIHGCFLVGVSAPRNKQSQ